MDTSEHHRIEFIILVISALYWFMRHPTTQDLRASARKTAKLTAVRVRNGILANPAPSGLFILAWTIAPPALFLIGWSLGRSAPVSSYLFSSSDIPSLVGSLLGLFLGILMGSILTAFSLRSVYFELTSRHSLEIVAGWSAGLLIAMASMIGIVPLLLLWTGSTGCGDVACFQRLAYYGATLYYMIVGSVGVLTIARVYNKLDPSKRSGAAKRFQNLVLPIMILAGCIWFGTLPILDDTELPGVVFSARLAAVIAFTIATIGAVVSTRLILECNPQDESHRKTI